MDAGAGATAIRVPYRHLRDAEMELVSLNGGAPGGDTGPPPPPPKDQPRSRADRTKLVLACMVAAGVQFGWALQLSLLTPYIQVLLVTDRPSVFFPDSGILTTPRLNCQDRGKIHYLARNLANTTQITARLADTAAGFVWIPQYYAKLNCLRPVVMSHTNAGMMIKMYCNNHLGRPVSMIFLYHSPTSHFCHVFTCCSFLNFVQTLGIDHAMASFIWLCGPITGFVVSHPLLFFLPWVIVRIRAMLMCCLPRFNLVLVFGVISAVQSMGGEDHLFWLDA